MPTFTTVDAAWDTGVTLDHAELRRADTTMFLGDGSNNGVRGGIVRHGPTSLAVSVNGSDQVTVQAGSFVVPSSTGLGVYRGALQAALGPGAGTALSPRNGTNPRIDLIVVQVGTGGGAIVKTIDGTPSSSPSAPALPAQHIELARVRVEAVGGGAATVDSTWRQYATAIGGKIVAETFARLPTSGNQAAQQATALDTGLTYAWDGAAWQQAPTPGAALSAGNDFNISTAAVGSPLAASVTLSPGHWVVWGKGYSDNGTASAVDHFATLFNATASAELDRAVVTLPTGAKNSWALMTAVTLAVSSTIQLRMWPSATGSTQLMNRVKLVAQRSGV